MMIADFNDSVANLSSGDDSIHEIYIVKNENSISKPSSSKLKPSKNSETSSDEPGNDEKNGSQPCKMSVRFDSNIRLYHLSTTYEEKRAKWYDSSEFYLFKHEVAKEAGVKIIRCNKDNRFAMVGDFDCQTNSTNKGDPSRASKGPIKKLYYNENEYGDTCNQNGEVICKRGLGYHFSRNRKKSRVANRSVVLAWQKMLHDRANQTNPKFEQSLPTLGSESDTLEKTISILALVSVKRSRVAREEAQWRGDVDYRVAHPERHTPTAPAPTVSTSSLHSQSKKGPDFGVGKRDGAYIGAGPFKKRMCSGTNVAARLSVARCKGDGLSPALIG